MIFSTARLMAISSVIVEISPENGLGVKDKSMSLKVDEVIAEVAILYVNIYLFMVGIEIQHDLNPINPLMLL